MCHEESVISPRAVYAGLRPYQRTAGGDDAEFRLILMLFLDEVEGVIMRLSRRHAPQMETDLHFPKSCA